MHRSRSTFAAASANKTGKTQKQVEDAIHAAKQDNLKAGGEKRNPDVQFDPETGELYPEIPGGGFGDSIGNLYHYF